MSSGKGHLHRYDPPQPQHRPSTLSELAILKKHHQFIRDDEDNAIDQQSKLSWEDKLALSWYSKLFREYAVCDLTHYKTGGVALRWRTEAEVLDRIGEVRRMFTPF
jgi:protein FRA10AC1